MWVQLVQQNLTFKATLNQRNIFHSHKAYKLQIMKKLMEMAYEEHKIDEAYKYALLLEESEK